MDPITISYLSQMLYQERLDEAANERRARKQGRRNPSFQGRLLSSLGDLLIASGEKLRRQAQPDSAPFAFQSE